MAYYPAWGGGSGITGIETVLWTNPNPTNTYSSGTADLSMGISNFKFLKITHKQINTGADEMSVYVPVDDLSNTSARIPIGWIANATLWSRMLQVVSDTSISISMCYKFQAANQGVSYVIPLSITGIR